MNDKTMYLSPDELKKYKITHGIGTGFIYLFLVLIALFIIIPFYWMFATSLRTTAELEATTITFFPKDPQFKNFIDAYNYPSQKTEGITFMTYFLNTIWVAIWTTLGTMVTTVFAAFAFARLNFKGKNLIFSILLSTMMIPGEIFVITNYMTISKFGQPEFLGGLFSWAGKYTYGALILPFMTSIFYIFFLRQTFQQIPNELYLAAKVDGVSDFGYLFKVMIPLAKATLTTILILSMMGTWNAYIWPSLVANDGAHMLVSNGLLASFKNTDTLETVRNLQMAAATLVTIPLLITFICLRKYIMRGVSRSGIKG